MIFHWSMSRQDLQTRMFILIEKKIYKCYNRIFLEHIHKQKLKFEIHSSYFDDIHIDVLAKKAMYSAM